MKNKLKDLICLGIVLGTIGTIAAGLFLGFCHAVEHQWKRDIQSVNSRELYHAPHDRAVREYGK